jgi:pectate lyase
MPQWTVCSFSMVALLMVGFIVPASSKTLTVGPDQQYTKPSDAAKVAADGDTVEILPLKGGYYDCALWQASNLTIEGKGDGVIITDTTCMGKGLFIINGKDVTVRNITFQRARVPDGNGAGIRAQGVNLRIEHCHFLNNENGILSNPSPDSTIIILDSEFVGNGVCDTSCSHGIYINASKLLHVEHNVFRAQKIGHHIKSRSSDTEIVNNQIEDGPTGTASYLIDVANGGTVLIKDNVMEKGPMAENHTCAIIIGEEGVNQPTPEIIVTGNTLTNDMDHPTIFVKNMTATEAKLSGNIFKGEKITPLTGDGTVD